MEKLGYVRQVMGQWAVGNEYLRRWLKQESETLRRVQAAALNETSFEELLRLGYTQENQAFQTEVGRLESSYAELADRRHRGEHSTADLEQELDRLQRYLSAARRDLNRTEGSAGHRNLGDGDPSVFRTHSWRDV
jgi:chromosome segregation ATPase